MRPLGPAIGVATIQPEHACWRNTLKVATSTGPTPTVSDGTAKIAPAGLLDVLYETVQSAIDAKEWNAGRRA